jgi:phytanoyl-CoA hydroxylase
VQESGDATVREWRRRRVDDEQLAFWGEYGYLVLPGFFGADRIAEINHELDALWTDRSVDDRNLIVDAFIDTPRERRMRLRDVPDEARTLPYKLNDLYLDSEFVREIALDPRLADVLGDLLDGAPIAFNSLNFERGSQQRLHFDTFYMPPSVENKMLATWVALEDTDVRSGPLRYFPGSHKIPPYHFVDGRLNARPEEMPDFDVYIDRELTGRGLEQQTFCAKAGDVFIWSAQLYHGGAPIEDMSLTRRSLVTHYFRAQEIDTAIYVGTVEDIGGERFYLRKAHQTPAD